MDFTTLANKPFVLSSSANWLLGKLFLKDNYLLETQMPEQQMF